MSTLPLSEQAEETLERLWAELVEAGRSRLPTASTALVGHEAGLEELARGELVRLRTDPSEVELTPRGREMATVVVRRHRLAERMLTDVLEVGGEQMDEAACQIEHSLRGGVDEAVCTLLGHPDHCPHGKPIPAGDCCRQVGDGPAQGVVPLHSLRPGQEGRIAYVQTDEARRLQKLMAMGVLPGKAIRLIQGFPSFVFQLGHSQFAVDREIARTIHVRLDPTPDGRG